MAPLAWWETQTPRVKRMGTIAASLTAILALVGVVANQLSLAEGYWVAHREFVRELVAQSERRGADERAAMSKRAVRTEIQVLRGQRSQIVGEIKRRELLLKDPAAQAVGAYRDLVQEQIDQYREQLKELNNEIAELQRELSGRRP